MDLSLLLVYTIIGLVTGFFTGMLGIGGGSIRVPLLSFAGMPLINAFATSMFAIPFSSLIGAYTQRKNIDWKIAKIFTVGAVLGIIIATVLVGFLSNEILALLFFFATLISIGGLYLNKINKKLFDYLKPTTVNLFFGGFLGNIIIGLRGGSGGTLFPPILYSLEAKMHTAIAVSLFAGFFSSFFALCIYFFRGDILFLPAVVITITGIIGSYLGSKISMKTDAELLKLIFTIVILIFALLVVHSNFL
ncbi:sulfite exporter TauE/SafE family protein [Candidatus Micrarchaeota archaeon]|nr:sulfite exporter TauE/SafE family protein [Candidatus Micrarchaeota archaeon]